MGSLAARFFRSCVYVFGGVVLLIWAVELLCRYWWVLALAGVVALLVAVWRWYRQRW
ncbi:MAG: hypothetical protein HXL00_01085 [Candidatus Nanosynbacter sp.]|nr:hypothetical protein [Candidatus Nanosynbacter sp.]